MANLLDSKYAPCRLVKFGMAIPMGLVIALITYISYTFIWLFIPHYFDVSSHTS